MLGRVVFAAIGFAVFLIAFIGGFLGGFAWIAIPIVFLLYLGLSLALRRREGAVGWMRFFTFFLRTNNRWLLTMFVLTLISFAMALNTSPGGPLVQASVQEQSSTEHALSDIRERYHNLHDKGEFKTDAELSQQKKVPEFESWAPWWFRWVGALVLLILALGYVPFAFTDEVKRAASRTHAHLSERTHGEAGENWFTRFMHRLSQGQAAPAGPTPTAVPPAGLAPQPTTTVAGAAWRTGIKLFLIELLAEFLASASLGGRKDVN